MREEEGHAIFRKEPGGPMKLINEFFQQRPKRTLLDQIDDYFRERLTIPSFKIHTDETDQYFIVTAELPGIPKEDIRVKLLDDELIIAVKKNAAASEYEATKKIRGAKQTIEIPSYVLAKKMKANYKDGILRVRFPKKRGKSIEID
ncbi:Hsp20/alpha crystallin family protein [Bacillus alveayuensis]|jgi:HSP20 family protein|uniref:Hsp20/alpha crystallin family protein n=1 Tax=Aeribacillus alveayuensis TaxID=279215 RepID=UPI0005CDC154|nr:Hsp20/alpha crystallin family protein [Bacillus alveayuensis]